MSDALNASAKFTDVRTEYTIVNEECVGSECRSGSQARARNAKPYPHHRLPQSSFPSCTWN